MLLNHFSLPRFVKGRRKEELARSWKLVGDNFRSRPEDRRRNWLTYPQRTAWRAVVLKLEPNVRILLLKLMSQDPTYWAPEPEDPGWVRESAFSSKFPGDAAAVGWKPHPENHCWDPLAPRLAWSQREDLAKGRSGGRRGSKVSCKDACQLKSSQTKIRLAAIRQWRICVEMINPNHYPVISYKYLF